jgi:hypothetical protein
MENKRLRLAPQGILDQGFTYRWAKILRIPGATFGRNDSELMLGCGYFEILGIVRYQDPPRCKYRNQ